MADAREVAAEQIAAARAGSAEALGQLLDACRGYLLVIAQQEIDPALRAKGGASDLVQETLLHAVRGFPGFQGTTEAELLGWLRRQLLNNLTDFTRSYRTTAKRQLSQEVRLEADNSSSDQRGELAAAVPTPSGEAMAHEQDLAIQQAIQRLPEDYRRVLALRYQEGQSFEEIGQVMGLSANAARKLWVRAIKRLQQDTGEPP